MSWDKGSSFTTSVDGSWSHSSQRTVTTVISDVEPLQKANRRFATLTGATVQLIRKKPTATTADSQNKTLTAKVLPDDVFCLVEIPVVGKFGAFYQGFDKSSWTRLTLKIFKPRIFANGGSRREKQILSLTNKPNTVPKLLAAFSFELQNCLVLEYMTAHSLQDRLSFCRRFPPNVVLFFMSDMVMAISFLHSKRLIHRSITLNAFWIQADGHLKLVDYTRCIKMHSWFRKNPKRWNTLDYVPPEMLRIGLCTKAVDMWALGVILYKMTTGRQPFYADTHTNLIRRIRQNDVECNYLFSEMAADLCRQLLQKNPKHRLGHAGDTFLCISNHPYFSKVSWDQVLNGTSKAPEITFLMSAEHHSEYKVRPLDFRTSANRATALKNKPLLLQEISTKSVTEMFNKEILDINHAFDMAKYQHEKSGFSLPIHKHTDRYSFQNITKSMTSERVAMRERSPSVSGGSKPTSDTNLKSPASQPSTPPLDAALSLMFMSLRLEGLFRTALLDFEAKVKQGVPTLIALEEFRDFITRNIDEIRASSILRHPIRNMGAVKTPLSTRPNTT